MENVMTLWGLENYPNAQVEYRSHEHDVDLNVIVNVVVRLSKCLEHSTPLERLPRSAPAIPDPTAAVLPWRQAMRAAGLSLQAMADRLNTEGLPTQSGHGHWQKGTIGEAARPGEGDWAMKVPTIDILRLRKKDRCTTNYLIIMARWW
jgi:hypothetical protein